MAVQIASLVGDWDISQTNVVVVPTEQQVAKANPRRYAIGFCLVVPLAASFPPSDDKVSLSTIPGGNNGFLQGYNGEIKWFDFHKHGILVNQTWFARLSALNAVAGNLCVIEIEQSPTAGE